MIKQGRTRSVPKSMPTAFHKQVSILTLYFAAVPCSQLLRFLPACRVSDGCCMSLFKRAIRTRFSPEGVNRRVDHKKRPAPADGIQTGKKKAEGHISTKHVRINACAS